MRDLFRLIAVALLSFLMVGAAMVYSRGDGFSTTFRAVTDQVSNAVGDVGGMLAGPAEGSVAAPTTYALAIPRPNAALWVGLAGFPDQSEVVFPIPRGGQYVSGALNLVFDTQLTEHGDGLLTLSVNGTRRGQVVLDAGRRTHQVRIELTPTDLGGDRVVLRMEGRGTTNSGQICPTDATNSGSAITLTADSKLELEAEQPLTDSVGVLAASTQTLVLSPGQNPGDMAMTVWANEQFNRAGVTTRLGEAGSGEMPVEITSHAVAAAGVTAHTVLAGQQAVDELADATGSALLPPTAWPVRVEDLGAETIVKSFRGSRRWTIPFVAADLPGGALPEAFGLRLKVTPLASGNDWVVRITLNGNLIETRRIGGNADTIAFNTALPAERLLPTNALMVELVDTTPNEGICTRLSDAQAQLLPESVLLDTASASDGWAGLIEQLASAPDISLTAADGLSLTQASRASDLVGALVSRQAKVRFDDGGAISMRIVDRAGLAAATENAHGAMEAVLPVTTGAGPSLKLLAVDGPDFADAVARLGPDDVLVLVTRT